MSGIVGVYHLQGDPISHPGLADMLQAIAHRGPDGHEVWYGEGLGLGHAALNTTPEAAHERWPLRSPDGTRVLVADARIDNRKELCSKLSLSRSSEAVVTDADLILAAYEHWGVECARHLIGDFAFALWDEERRHLFCARDVFGVRPFFYRYDEERRFAFASEIKALLECEDDGAALNEEHMADFLVGIVSDATATVYKDILRLPPAHTALVTRTGLRFERYWAPDPDRRIHYSTDAEYAAAFRAHFDEAVRCRMRSPGGCVGALLSGGLDSSSIVATAREKGRDSATLHTFSTVFDEHPSCDERRYIEAVTEKGGAISHVTSGDEVSPVRLLDTLGASQDQPFGAPTLALSWLQYTKARAEGCRVLLDGHGGDEVVSHGEGRLFELAKAGHWGGLARELYGLRRTGRVSSAWALFWRYVWGVGIGPWLQSHPRAQAVWNTAQQLKTVMPNGVGGEALPPEREELDLLTPSVRGRTAVEERYHTHLKARGRPASEAERHARLLTHPVQVQGFEVLDPLGASRQVETRYPFWDRRLVEFCLALPADQKLRNGLGRFVLRSAMQGRLPASVRLRPTKADFLPFLREDMIREKKRVHSLLFSPLRGAKEYVEETELREIWCRLSESEGATVQPRDVFSVWTAAVFLHWFRRRKKSVGANDGLPSGYASSGP